MNDFNDIENKSRELLTSLRYSLVDYDFDLSNELIDVGEYGVALENICFALSEDKIAVSGSIFDLIKSLAEQMQMDNSIWKDIRRQSE